MSVTSVPGWRTVELDAPRSTIRLARGVELDLGATAKALAADRAAERAHERAGCGVLVGLGGDIAVAGPAPASGWRVRVTDDHRAGVEAPGQWIAVGSGGLATSSTTVRRWRRRDAIRPPPRRSRLGRAGERRLADGQRRGCNCLDANIASTAAIVRGERGRSWLASLGLPAGWSEPIGLSCTSPAGRRPAMTSSRFPSGPPPGLGRAGESVTAILGAAGPSAYWYLARGTGAVSLVLLTASVVLGILGSLRFSAARGGRGSRSTRCTATSRCWCSCCSSPTSSRACSTASRRSG